MSIPLISAIRSYLQSDGLVILPEIELLLFGLGILLIDFWLERKEKYLNAGMALAGTLFSGFTLWKLRGAVALRGDLYGFHQSAIVDSFFIFFGALFLAATALVILLSVKYLEIEEEQEGEYYALLLFACVGMMFMASGVDLIVLFLGLETMALSFYVLTGFLRREKRSNEAALKYVLLGAFSSGILAYGFALLLRLFTSVFEPSRDTWMYLIAGIAVASLTWGNLAALTQTNVKRLLAYSSISHVGYILLALVAWNKTAVTGIAYYWLSYVFMTAGACAVIIVLRQKGIIGEELDDLNGLYQRSPAAAVLLLIFMLSLAGIPPTAGFMGKYFIFLSLIETHHPVLAVFAVLYIVPALYYYFRIIVHAWLKQPGEAQRPVMSSAQAVALGVKVFVTLAAGLYPQPFIRFAEYALGR